MLASRTYSFVSSPNGWDRLREDVARFMKIHELHGGAPTRSPPGRMRRTSWTACMRPLVLSKS
eukprot:3043630-Alexandrium_andersonii.AAC.1